MENNVVPPYRVVEGTVYITPSGHLHRRPTKGYGYSSFQRTPVPRGLLYSFGSPISDHRISSVEDLKNFAAEHGGTVLFIKRKHYLRKKEDGEYRIHRHKNHRRRPQFEAPEQVGEQAYILTAPTVEEVQKLEEMLAPKKAKSSRSTKKIKASEVSSLDGKKAPKKKKSTVSKVVDGVKKATKKVKEAVAPETKVTKKSASKTSSAKDKAKAPAKKTSAKKETVKVETKKDTVKKVTAKTAAKPAAVKKAAPKKTVSKSTAESKSTTSKAKAPSKKKATSSK